VMTKHEKRNSLSRPVVISAVHQQSCRECNRLWALKTLFMEFRQLAAPVVSSVSTPGRLSLNELPSGHILFMIHFLEVSNQIQTSARTSVRRLLIPSAICGYQESQSLRGFHRGNSVQIF